MPLSPPSPLKSDSHVNVQAGVPFVPLSPPSPLKSDSHVNVQAGVPFVPLSLPSFVPPEVSSPSLSSHSHVEPNNTIVISPSPVKKGSHYWLPNLFLFPQDKVILETNAWLNDAIIQAAQSLLKQQTNGEVFGWQSPQCAKTTFQPIPQRQRFIQIIHKNKHWITVSNNYYRFSECQEIWKSLFCSNL